MDKGMVTESTTSRIRVLMVCGYFDEFSGYNEVILANALGRVADVTVVAGDRVSPVFTDSALASKGYSRRYATGLCSTTRSYSLYRVRSYTPLNTVLPVGLTSRLRRMGPFDLVLQMSPGQMFPLPASFSPRTERRLVIFPDNTLMRQHHSWLGRTLRAVAFAVSKGVAYRLMARRATSIFATTPNGQDLVSRIVGRDVGLLPLGFDPSRYKVDAESRRAWRGRLEIGDNEIALVVPGKLAPEKNIEGLLGAFEALGRGDAPHRLVVTGFDDSDYARSVKTRMSESSRSGDIITLPFIGQDEMASVFNACDVAIWPKNPGITIQQALGTGIFVLLPDSDTVSHLVGKGNGRYFDPSGLDSAVLANGCGELAVDELSRTRRSERSRWLSVDELASVIVGTEARGTARA